MSNTHEPGQPPGTPQSSHRGRWVIVAVVAVIAVGLGVWVLTREATVSREPSPPQASPVAAQPEPLPPAARTDPRVRDLVGSLCSAPGLAKWLATDDLLRRIAGAVDSVSRGESPRAQLGFLAPEGDFRVRRRRGETFIDPRSYERYDGMAATIAAIDMQSCAKAYAELAPMLEKAYREVGPPQRSFDEALARALKRLTALPPREGAVRVERGVTYRFADPELEALSPAEKHLLRMGPRNMRAVQTKLRELGAAIELPEIAGG